MKTFLFFLLIPACISAQESRPVISEDYLHLISRDSTVERSYFLPDSTNSIRNSSLKIRTYYNGYTAKKLKIKDGEVTIHPANTKTLLISGNFNSTVEIKQVNHRPHLQNQFVQGRSENGILNWRGPETGELFSYGPAITTLEFDGTSYPYDINGRLVHSGASNAQKAIVYKNSIFRNGNLLSQSLNVQGKYLVKEKPILSSNLNVGQAKENSFIIANRNHRLNISATIEALIKSLTLSGSFTSAKEKFSNDSRFGFLNRVYQNSLLTPISFDNAQGNTCYQYR